MSRPHRAKLAQETVAICEAGRYLAPGGTEYVLFAIYDRTPDQAVVRIFTGALT